MRKEKFCQFCNKKFFTPPKRKKQKFCSQECCGKSQRTAKIRQICKYCKKVFFAKLWQKAKFCSHQCFAKNSKKQIQKICKQCNKEFIVLPSLHRVKFCSRICANNDKRGKPNGKKGKRYMVQCEICGKGQEVSYYLKDKKKFCSKECANISKIGKMVSPKTQFRKGKSYWLGKKRPPFSKEWKANMGIAQQGEKHHAWRGGTSFEPYSPTFNQQLKDKIRVRDNFICQLCGVPELECWRRLDVHHIDYDKKNCNEDNLISLCIKCNLKVNVNREYWKTYFQNKIGGKKKCRMA